MKKITLMLGVLALAAFPAMASANYDSAANPGETASVDPTSELTLNVLAAVELSTPASDEQSQAPTSSLNTSNTLSNTVTFGQASDIRSNLSWSVAVTGDSAFAKVGNGVASLNSAAMSKGSGSTGTRNTTNGTQSAGTQTTQQVSWADEAGIYDAEQIHTATQSLPAE